jgi:BASS family bile acid:Na+ symporter
MRQAITWKPRLFEFVHRHILGFLVGSYVLAAVAPEFGLRLRSLGLFGAGAWGLPEISAPSILLAFLLFSAGLGVGSHGLRSLARRPWILAVGVAANLFLPVAFILGTATTMQLWHNPREVQEVLVSLALIASMPVAGSSTTWVQNADGDLALSIGLVVLTTCLSPITTPMVLHAVSWMADGTYSVALHDLAAGGISGFLASNVLAPSVAGIVVGAVAGGKRIGRLRPFLKLASTGVLLVLCYANAAVALPQTIRQPDWDYLVIMLAIVTIMCAMGFVAGRLIGRAMGADRARCVSLMFGLGMNNNGTGLVVAAEALPHIPAVMVPIIFYNLVQHIVAACVDRFWISPSRSGRPSTHLPQTQPEADRSELIGMILGEPAR